MKAQNRAVAPSNQEQLDRLTPAQREALERKLLERRARSAKADRIPKLEPGGPRPLSFAQERMWFLNRLQPEASIYNVPEAMRVRGAIDVDAFAEAVNDVAAVHEILRTTYTTVGGEPTQVVGDPGRFDVPMIDLSVMEPDARAGALAAHLDSVAASPFDLEAGPVQRWRVYRLADDDHVVQMVVHHIAYDGVSQGLLWRQIVTAYEARRSGLVPAVAEPELQYADFAAWQRSATARGDFARQLDHWRTELADAPALLELPTDFPRPAIHRGVGRRVVRTVPAGTLEGLHRIAREQRTTLFVTLLSAWQLLLARTTGQPDVVVGTPVAGRSRSETEDLVGCFVNTLALRTTVDGSLGFRSMVDRVHETVVTGFDNQDVPFEHVVAELAPERDLSITPIFQVMIVLHNQAGGSFDAPGLHITPESYDRDASPFDLTLVLREDEGVLRTTIEYSTELFDAATVGALVDRFTQLLAGVVADPEAPVATVAIISPEERHFLLEGCNATAAPYSSDMRLDQLVGAQVAARPDAVAVVADDATLTYSELDARVNRLAHELQALGVGPGIAVGVCCERSTHLAVSLLATLRAGGVCLPLDPVQPTERLAVILADAGDPMVLTTRLQQAILPAASTVVVLDDVPVDRMLGARVVAAPATTAGPDDVAYLIYTSGSTGVPKGVELRHRSLVNYVTAIRDRFGFTPEDRVLQISSIGFDMSIKELYGAWTTGATAVLRSELVPIAGPEFLDWLHERRVTVMCLPTGYWHEWVRDIDVQGATVPSTLRAVIVGGEKALVATYQMWQRVGGAAVRWINVYGPTETSVIATSFEAGPDHPIGAGDIPIGSPIANVRLYVLDEQLEPVPVGVRGELYIGGVGLARGYRNKPELTAERFVVDPFVSGPSAFGDEPRMYRTGDIVRRRSDGDLEYVGRTDNQVKLSGFRIELGEIEHAIGAHPAISAALVRAVGDSSARHLVAWAVVAPHREPGHTDRPTSDELRSFVRERLPAYMVPSAFVVLDEFPLTPNGKVDVRALPQPSTADHAVSDIVAPRNADERRMHEVWQRVLGIDVPISVHAGFFDIGGHSVMAVRLFSEIEREFSVRLPLTAIFQGGTIAELAASVARPAPVEERFAPVVTLQQGRPGRPHVYLAPWANGEVLGFRPLVERLPDDIPVFGLQSLGLDGRTYPHRSIEQMAVYFTEAILERDPDGPFVLGGFCFGGMVGLRIAQLLTDRNKCVQLLVLFDTNRGDPDAPVDRVAREREIRQRFEVRNGPARWAYVKKRAWDATMRVYLTVWWMAFDLWERRRWPLPRVLSNLKRVNTRSLRGYRYRDAPCPVLILRRGDEDLLDSYYDGPFRAMMEHVHLDIRVVAPFETTTHLEVMQEPVVAVTAAEVLAALERSSAAGRVGERTGP